MFRFVLLGVLASAFAATPVLAEDTSDYYAGVSVDRDGITILPPPLVGGPPGVIDESGYFGNGIDWYSFAQTGTDYVKARSYYEVIDDKTFNFAVRSSSSVLTSFTPTVSARVTVNGLARGLVSFQDPLSFADRGAQMLATGVDADTNINASMNYTTTLTDLTSGAFHYLSYDLSAIRNIITYKNPAGNFIITSDSTAGVVITRLTDIDETYSNPIQVDRQPGIFGVADVDYSYDFDFIVGHQYMFQMAMSCSADVSYSGAPGASRVSLQGVFTECNAGNSGYWNGITNAPTEFGLIGANGQNYLYSSALSPDPLVLPPTASVPEPSAWAMMMLGFGAIGLATRRRGQLTTNFSFA